MKQAGSEFSRAPIKAAKEWPRHGSRSALWGPSWGRLAEPLQDRGDPLSSRVSWGGPPGSRPLHVRFSFPEPPVSLPRRSAPPWRAGLCGELVRPQAPAVLALHTWLCGPGPALCERAVHPPPSAHLQACVCGRSHRTTTWGPLWCHLAPAAPLPGCTRPCPVLMLRLVRGLSDFRSLGPCFPGF